MGYFPLFYNLKKKSLLIVGGGRIALAKLETLVEYSSNITLVALDFLADTKELAEQYDLKLITADYADIGIANYDVIIGATDDHKLNEDIARDASSQGKIVNIVDDPAKSDFIFPAIVKRNDFIVAISSGGVSPVLARLVKQKIEKIIPASFTKLDEFIKSVRAKVKAKLTEVQPRRIFWQEVLESEIVEEITAGNTKKAEKKLLSKLNQSADNDNAAVYFIGAGPGDPDLMTLKAIRLLSRADIVLYDRLVAPQILNYARKDALKISVGKTKDHHHKSQAEINELLRQYVKEGNIVARLKGGDTAIFAHLAEEIAAIKEFKVPFQVVPGVSSANGAAAYSGIPLTIRNQVKAVRFLTLYKEDIYNEAYWQDMARSNDTLVFYMSASQVEMIVANLLKFAKNPDTGVAVIEQATTEFQKTYVSSLKDFTKKYSGTKFVSPSIVIIGEAVAEIEHYKWFEENLTGKYFADFKQDEKQVKHG